MIKTLILSISILLTYVNSFTLLTNVTIPKIGKGKVLYGDILWSGNVIIWADDQNVREYDAAFANQITQWDVHASIKTSKAQITQMFKDFALSPLKQIIVGCLYQTVKTLVFCCRYNYLDLTNLCFGTTYIFSSTNPSNVSVAFLQNEQIITVAVFDKIFQFNCTSGVKLNQVQLATHLMPNSFVRTPYQILSVSRFYNILSISIINGINNITVKYIGNTSQQNYQIFYDAVNNHTLVVSTALNNMTLMSNPASGNMTAINTTSVNFNTTQLASCYIDGGLIYLTAGLELLEITIINGSIVDSLTFTTGPIYMFEVNITTGPFLPHIYWKTNKIIEIYQTIAVQILVPCLDNTSNCIVCDLNVTGQCQQCSQSSMTIVNGVCLQLTVPCLDNTSNCVSCDINKTGNCLLCSQSSIMIIVNGICQFRKVPCLDKTLNCIRCETILTGYCIECSSNYYSVNGICQQIRIIQIVIKTTTTIGMTMSLPNLRIFLKPLGGLFQNLQDYWFYIDHDRKYSVSLSIVFDSIKLINQQKMYPKFLRLAGINDYTKIDPLYNSQFLPVTPLSFYAEEQKDLNFLVNTNEMYTISYFSSLVTILITRLIYWFLFQIRVCKKISFVINFFRQSGLYKQILVAFLEANLIFISFHCFLQIKQPYYKDVQTKVNMIITICFLFGAIMYGLCFYFMVYALSSKRDAETFLILKKNAFSGFLCETIITGFKCLFNGFCHGYLLDNYILQISLLSLCKLLLVIVIFILLRSFRKIMFGVFILIYYIAGLLLDLTLLVEYLLQKYDQLTIIILESAFFIIMTGMIISFILLSVIVPCCDGIKTLKNKFVGNSIEPEKEPQSIVKQQTRKQNKKTSKIETIKTKQNLQTKKIIGTKKQIHIKAADDHIIEAVPIHIKAQMTKNNFKNQLKIKTKKVNNNLVVLETEEIKKTLTPISLN